MQLDSSSTVLVTGATGFIGQHLTNELIARGVAVRVLTRSAGRVPAAWQATSVTLRVADLLDSQTLRDACDGVDAIFHLASHIECSNTDISEGHFRLSVQGTKALLNEAERSAVKRFVYASSVKAMGEVTQGCADEHTEARPISSYGKAKLLAEQLIASVDRSRMQTANLRLPMVYGVNRKVNLMRMIAAIDRGRFPPLPETGNKRSMVHVDDVVQAFMLAAEIPARNGQTYIVTDGQAYSTRQIYEAICRSLGRRVPRWICPVFALKLVGVSGDLVARVTGWNPQVTSEAVAKLVGSAWYSCAKIQRELGYRPLRDLYSAIPEMVNEYRTSHKQPTEIGGDDRRSVSGPSNH